MKKPDVPPATEFKGFGKKLVTMQEELMRCLEQLDAIDMSGCVTDVAANRKQMVDRTNVKNETNSTPLRTHVSAQF